MLVDECKIDQPVLKIAEENKQDFSVQLFDIALVLLSQFNKLQKCVWPTFASKARNDNKKMKNYYDDNYELCQTHESVCWHMFLFVKSHIQSDRHTSYAIFSKSAQNDTNIWTQKTEHCLLRVSGASIRCLVHQLNCRFLSMSLHFLSLSLPQMHPLCVHDYVIYQQYQHERYYVHGQ